MPNQKQTLYQYILLSLLLLVLMLPSDGAVESTSQQEKAEKQVGQCRLPPITALGTMYMAWNERLGPWSRRRYSQANKAYRQAMRGIIVKRSQVMICRLGLMAMFLLWSGWAQKQTWYWGLLAIVVVDVWFPQLGWMWPELSRKQSYQYMVSGVHQLYVGLLCLLWVEGLLTFANISSNGGQGMFLLAGWKEADGAQAKGKQEEDGTWRVELTGSFNIKFKPRNQYEQQAFLYFLRLISSSESNTERPFFRQTWLAKWFELRQENISQWERTIKEGGLLKLCTDQRAWVLTSELVSAILDIWIPNFWLSATQVKQRLLAEGHITCPEELPIDSIYRVARECGFAEVRQKLRQMLQFSKTEAVWRDGVLVNRLFELNESLLARLAAGSGLIPQITLEVEALKQALGATVTSFKKPLPLAYQMQRTLFGQWQDIEDSLVRCPHCGSDLVARKSNKPRCKKYHHPQTGQWLQVEGYRYYCRNPHCDSGSFTNYPEGIRLHSCWSVDTMLWGVMVYMQMGTTYRRASQAVGVSHVTLWRWAQLVGQQSLPIATLFGVVRCSGVVGVDEKWVLVPKNDKPDGKRKRWMYVYLAVDVHTYDLLHIDIFPFNGKVQARAFLQALKAKGYQPQVIITDMNQDYDQPIREVFPKAKHHECIFHALQWAQRLIKDVYGNDYASAHPAAVDLKHLIYHIFAAKSRKTVNKRYQEVMALKDQYISVSPQSIRIFNFLDAHYPKLVNAIEDPLTPLTNNSVELVIRRFDQHYQNMTGFDCIETARIYLNLFELSYRFSPFAKDNRPVPGRTLDIRGKCPLELAGYDISHMPIAQIMRSNLLALPPDIGQHLVPNT